MGVPRELNLNGSSYLSWLAIFERGRVELPLLYYCHCLSRKPMARVLDNTDILLVYIPFFGNCNFNQSLGRQNLGL